MSNDVLAFGKSEIKAKPGNFHELDQTLQALLPTIRKEKGCRECRICRDVEDGEIFILSVHWGAPASLEHYMRSGSGGALLGAVDLLSETARVRLGQKEPWKGIDALKRMRKTPIPQRIVEHKREKAHEYVEPRPVRSQ